MTPRTNDDAVELALAHGLPYAGLRDERHDETLVPADVARRARIVALRADEHRVRLASAEPEPDLSLVREHLGARVADVVISPRAEIDAILGPPPPDEPAPIEVPPAAEAPAEPPAPSEEPSWLAPAPAPSPLRAALLVVGTLVVVCALIALALWLLA